MSDNDLVTTIKAYPISSVVGQFVSLRKNGQNYWGICPFHQDTKPSMSVNDQKGLFKCFACGAGGDAISFVQRMQNLDFKESLKEICNILGIAYDSFVKEKKIDPKEEMAHRILKGACNIYQAVAQKSNPPEYQEFVKQRQLRPATLEQFQIGFALPSNELYEFLNKKVPAKELKFALQVALELQIIRQNENRADQYYDLFRKRIMFPIWDALGQVVGFSSRAVDDKQKAKYLNSMDSFAFHKGNVLFAYNFAKKAIRQKNRVIIVEGHMDAIMMHQCGFDETIALMGVALSERARKLLISQTKNIYLALDNDEAGLKAGRRINQEFLADGIIPHTISFHPVKDADDFLKAEGAESLKNRIEHAPFFIDEELERLLPPQAPQSTHERLQYLRDVFSLLRPLGENLEAIERLMGAATRLGVQTSKEEIIKQYREGAEQNSKTQEPEIIRPSREIKAAPQQRATKMSTAELKALRAIIAYPKILTHAGYKELLDLFTNSVIKDALCILKELYFEVDDEDYLVALSGLLAREQFALEIKDQLAGFIFDCDPQLFSLELDAKQQETLLQDLKALLQSDDLKKREEDLKEQLSMVEDAKERERIMLEIVEIRKRRMQSNQNSN